MILDILHILFFVLVLSLLSVTIRELYEMSDSKIKIILVSISSLPVGACWYILGEQMMLFWFINFGS